MKYKPAKRFFLFTFVFVLLTASLGIVAQAVSLRVPPIFMLSGGAQSATAHGNHLAAAIDEVCAKAFKPDEPGAAVIVVKDGKVIFRKGYGLANMELGVKVEPDMIFRIGSVTKQFTAVSILMLAEQSKLSLDDEITKYLTDYPAQGHRITIEHLLTHTSGIKSYTGLPEWRPQWRKDVSLRELIDLFKDKPMEFAPGEKWNYNNSAYVLLGAIIEKISGQSYGEFLEKNIFTPLGMKSTFYDDTARIIPRRAAGYSKRKDGYVNCDYLSMTWPHAAGALMSTVDDLALWDAALYTEKLVKQSSLKRAWTPYTLKSGKPTKYGYGWAMVSIAGHRAIEHGGGINGFTCDGVRLPDDRVYVAVLTNRDSGTGDIGHRIAALAVGASLGKPVAIKLSQEALDKYVGVYESSDKQEFVVRRQGDHLTIQHPLFGGVEIRPMSETEFFLEVSPSSRITFSKDASGRVTGFVMSVSIAPDEEAKRTDRPLPKPKEAAAVDPMIYDNYAGDYQLAPNFVITISREGNKLMGQATGQPKFELVPRSNTRFHIAVVNAEIEFTLDAEGKATGLTLTQGGQKMEAKRVK
jgi:CubicO group peptidase (beta-lactamase class C family)